ncbi:hypothetical protein [Fervidibacter sacchari]
MVGFEPMTARGKSVFSEPPSREIQRVEGLREFARAQKLTNLVGDVTILGVLKFVVAIERDGSHTCLGAAIDNEPKVLEVNLAWKFFWSLLAFWLELLWVLQRLGQVCSLSRS